LSYEALILSLPDIFCKYTNSCIFGWKIKLKICTTKVAEIKKGCMREITDLLKHLPLRGGPGEKERS
jgi:hypothetical protein